MEETAENKKMDGEEFLHFTQFLRDATSGMLNNSIGMFMLMDLFESSGDDKKSQINHFVVNLKKDMLEEHFDNVKSGFDFTPAQISVVERTIGQVVEAILQPITDLIDKYNKIPKATDGET